MNIKKLPQISEAEYEVMKVVWKKAPVNTNEITELLVKTTTWSPKTIHTLIKRLVNKGALSYEKEGRVFVYTPLVREDEYLEYENSSFLNRYYNGNLTSMLTNFLEKEKLSEKEIQDLKELLDKKTEGQ
jgi:BlaI family penicillinase repressor